MTRATAANTRATTPSTAPNQTPPDSPGPDVRAARGVGGAAPPAPPSRRRPNRRRRGLAEVSASPRVLPSHSGRGRRWGTRCPTGGDPPGAAVAPGGQAARRARGAAGLRVPRRWDLGSIRTSRGYGDVGVSARGRSVSAPGGPSTRYAVTSLSAVNGPGSSRAWTSEDPNAGLDRRHRRHHAVDRHGHLAGPGDARFAEQLDQRRASPGARGGRAPHRHRARLAIGHLQAADVPPHQLAVLARGATPRGRRRRGRSRSPARANPAAAPMGTKSLPGPVPSR